MPTLMMSVTNSMPFDGFSKFNHMLLRFLLSVFRINRSSGELLNSKAFNIFTSLTLLFSIGFQIFYLMLLNIIQVYPFFAIFGDLY